MRPPLKYGLCALASVLVSDQLSKYFLLGLMEAQSGQPMEITSFFNLVMVWNRGVSFGLLAEHDARLLLTGFALLVCLGLARWMFYSPFRYTATALGLIIGGALGNVVDRLRFGAVADFFDVHALGWHWPAFNIADSAICIGVALLCAEAMLRRS